MSRRDLLSSVSWRLGEPYKVQITRRVERPLERSDVTFCPIKTPALTREDFERELLLVGHACMYIPPRPHPRIAK